MAGLVQILSSHSKGDSILSMVTSCILAFAPHRSVQVGSSDIAII